MKQVDGELSLTIQQTVLVKEGSYMGLIETNETNLYTVEPFVPDKLAAFRQMASILAPRGIFGCNSAFYTGTYVPGTERFYRLWTRRAIGWLRKEHPDVRPSREEKAMAMQWITPQDYIDLLKQ